MPPAPLPVDLFVPAILEDGIDWHTRERLEELAPSRFTAPSGRAHTLEYREDGTVALSIELQELYGLAETPRIGSRRQPLLIVDT